MINLFIVPYPARLDSIRVSQRPRTLNYSSFCFDGTMKGFLGTKFDAEIKGRADGIVNATIEVYERISKELLPTPARFGGLQAGGAEGGQRRRYVQQ